MNSISKVINKEQIIFIPSFIKQGIIRNGLTYDDFLDLEKIRSVFSNEDLKYVINLNDNISNIFNNKKSIADIPSYLDNYWKNNNIYEQLLGVVNLDFDSLLKRLAENNGVVSTQEPYELINTHTTVVICVINSQIVDGGKIKEEFSKRLICEFLKLLYGYNSYNVLSKHPLYGVYLDNIN